MASSSLLLAALALLPSVSAQFQIGDLPNTWQTGQTGTNQCNDGNSQTSMCQTAHINSLSDFCLWAPPQPNSEVAQTEEIEVAWCTKPGHGTRLIPDGVITNAHFVITPDFVQVTGSGDLTALNIRRGDAGGELDPHGATGNGNPIGGLVFSNAWTGGEETAILEWTNFMSANQFCIRACRPGPNAWLWCNHIYDTMGCDWNMPANYGPGLDSCRADSGTPMGIYSAPGNGWGSTWHQGEPQTPAAHPAPASSSCTPVQDLAQATPFAGTPVATSAPISASQNASSSALPSSSVVSSLSIPSSSSLASLPSAPIAVASRPVFTVTAPTITSTRNFVVATPSIAAGSGSVNSASGSSSGASQGREVATVVVGAAMGLVALFAMML